MSKIEASLTHSQALELQKAENQVAQSDVKQIIQQLQQFIDANESFFQEGQISFLPIEARPSRRTGKIQVSYLMVNLTGSTIVEFKADLELSILDFNVTVENSTMDLDGNFLGQLADHHAILIIDEVNFEGQPTESEYQAKDLQVKVTNVEISSI